MPRLDLTIRKESVHTRLTLTPTFPHIKSEKNKTKQSKKKESFNTYKGYDSWKSGAEMTRQWEPSNHLAFYTWVVVSQEQKVVTRSTSKAPTYV